MCWICDDPLDVVVVVMMHHHHRYCHLFVGGCCLHQAPRQCSPRWLPWHSTIVIEHTACPPRLEMSRNMTTYSILTTLSRNERYSSKHVLSEATFFINKERLSLESGVPIS